MVARKTKRSAIKESLTFEYTIRTRIHIESEEDLEDTPFTYYLDADIGDTVYICEDADVYMREDKNGWVIFWHNKVMEHIPLSLLDRDDEEACNAKYRQAQKRYKAICNAALDGRLEKEFLPKNRKPSFDYSNASEVFKQFGESYNKSQLFDRILNESSLKEFFYYVPPHNEEDEEDSIIGYIAAVRDYQTQKTKYVDDDGNVCNSKSQAKVFDTKGKADYYSDEHCPEGWTHFVVALKKSDTLNESNVVIAQWRRDIAERLIKEANKIDSSYSFVEYDIGPKKEIKYKIFKNDDEYVGTFDVFTDEPYNSPYRFFFNHVNLPNVEFQGMDIDEFDKMFKDFITTDKRLGHRVFESSLKENECSLERLLSKAYVSEYKMVSKNSAIVRVRTSPALLTSDSMAARFEEDIPDGYELEVEYLGEDPVLGRNLDIYEVQLLKN